jgi:hypothetical protein
MKTFQYFPLFVSSFVVGGVMLFSPPAQSLIFQTTGFNFSSSPQIGARFVFSGLDGRPINFISITSPEFPLTQINNNNTTQVEASLVGGVIRFGESSILRFEIEDNPDGTSGFRFLDAQRIIATPTGIQEEPLPIQSLSATTSAGAQTPFSAYRVVNTGMVNGEPFDFITTLQAPGDQFTLFDATFTATFQVSSQAIPGYVPFDQLDDFGPPIEITIAPGGTTTVTNPQPLQSTPEPSVVASLSVISLAAFLKGKLSKINNSKPVFLKKTGF